ncbi:phage protein NinX family protein [Pseudomonas sp. EZ-C24]|uniref:phage protein NinX family protein n=1 Tax=Pseudomonas sp. EZ-C24 TaxID=2753617 RepID=UPI00165E15BF|nr:phage protein NinX family protein [Pseudomonas sp. EZ-C24]
MTDLIEVKTARLIGAPLDWAVAMAEDFSSAPGRRTTIWRAEEDPTSVSIRGAAEGFGYRPSANWEQGGPLIDKHRGSTQHSPGLADEACYSGGPAAAGIWLYGPTALVAFCRGFVHHMLGDTVQVPKELISQH